MVEVSETLLREQLDQVYTPIEIAKEEIWKRWNDKELKKRVEEFIREPWPDVFIQSPKAVLGRIILSPNFETIEFLKLANQIMLDPVCFGYLDDKIVTKNLDKYYLCKLYFDGGSGKKGGKRVSAFSLINFNEQNGHKIREVSTIAGISLADFHLKFSLGSGVKMSFFDGSAFLKAHGDISKNYYKYFLALFICHGVLFESYLLSDEYRILTEEVFFPNFKKLQELFGVKPLIVRLSNKEEEENIYWRFYPMQNFTIADKIIHESQL